MAKQEQSQSTIKERWGIRGFSVVEALLAGALFGLVTVGFIGAVIYGQESTALAGQRSRAAFLAEEGIEAVRNIRDESFNNLQDGSYGLFVSNYQWQLAGNSDTTDGFVRQVVISTINADENRKLVEVTVNWQQNTQRTGSIAMSTELTNWSAVYVPPAPPPGP